MSRSRFLKPDPLKRGIYAQPPVFPEATPYNRRKFLKPLYGLSTVCKEWYLALRDDIVKDLGWKVTARDKSGFIRAASDCDYNFSKGSMGKCFGNNENGILSFG